MLRTSEKIVRVLANAAVLGGTLLPALIYLFIGYSQIQQMVEDDAKVQAQRAGYGIAANPDVWRYATERLIDQIVDMRHEQTYTLIKTLDGTVLGELGNKCTLLCVRGRSPLKDFGVIVGEVQVTATFTPLLVKGLLIGLFGLVIGFLLQRLLYYRVIIPIEQIKNAHHELAFYDPLTQLPNRRLMLDRLQQAMASSTRYKRHIALLFIDLDNFKMLNDTLGHDKGDELLKQVAQRLKESVREGDTVARLGGDEFVIIMEDLSMKIDLALSQTETACAKILNKLTQDYQLIGRNFHSTPSIGVTLFIDHEQSVDDLLKQADIAMYQAKSAGRNTIRFFDVEMQAKVSTRALLEEDLRNAIEKNQLILFFQAQVYHDCKIIGAEVLLRWQHPERGMISPADFIPLAEETGLIVPIGQWVLDTACSYLKEWENSLLTQHLQLAVNVSGRQFRQPDYVEQVQQTINRHGINPDRIKLEVTESMVLENINETILKMNALRDIGLHFSMDDFGIGYSSLSSLKKLPLDQLKIDQSFVRDISTDPDDATIVQTIIAMANNLGMEIIAEGVETVEQLEFLHERGCPVFQGYLFSRPLPIDEFEALLRKSSSF